MKADSLKLSLALTILLSPTSICPSEAESKTRPVYLSSMSTPVSTPAPAVVPGLKPTTSSITLSKHFDQGLVYKKSGDVNRALIEFLQAIKENPRCIRAFYEQALIFRSKGYPKLAESSLCQALAVDPSFREARILLATVRLEAGNTGGAAQELTRSLGLADKPIVTAAERAPIAVRPSGKATLIFSADSSKENTKDSTKDSGKTELKSEAKVTTAKVAPRVVLENDDWAKRLKYLSVNGTGSLKAGEAFMFSEETGEAVIFLADGRRIRRIISAPQDTHELVKARRPDMLIPADLLYKLSTLGKLVGGDPSALIDLNDNEAPTSAREQREDKARRDKELFGDKAVELPAKASRQSTDSNDNGTLGELMDDNENDEHADNSFTRKAILEDNEFDKGPSAAAAADARKGPTLNSTEPAALKDFNKEPVTDSLMEKSQKLFSWLKKTLHMP